MAALIAMIAGLPGLIAVPVLDRDEALFAQATSQMLEARDFIDIRVQDVARNRKPVGIHWLQAASVLLASSSEAHRIWTYRIPSLLGAMLACGALAWGAARFSGPGIGLLAGAILGCSISLSVEAGIAKTDAVLCGATTLAMAAFARIYAAAIDDGVPRRGWRTRGLFWAGLALAILVKGPVGPLVVLLAGLALWAWDRKAPWMRGLGWGWGLILIAALVGPWAAAITVKTDGTFWTGALGPDMGGKVNAVSSGRAAPPGAHALFALLMVFPATALLPAALAGAWRNRAAPAARFAIAWLAPSWLVFELSATKLTHSTLPLYGALAWMAALAFHEPIGPWLKRLGAVLSLAAGVGVAALVSIVQARYGGPAGLGWAFIAEAASVAAGLAGLIAMLGRQSLAALAVALGLGVAAHAAAAGLAPTLRPLFLSRSILEALNAARLNPQAGLIPGPVAVVGYNEPSLIFLLGTPTVIGNAADAAEAIGNGQPVVVERRQDAAFQKAAAIEGVVVQPVATVSGLDYSSARTDIFTIYRLADSPGRPHGGAR